MPNCDFYALEGDFELVLDFVFAQHSWELHELDTEGDRPVRVFRTTADVLACCAVGGSSCRFQLYAPEMAGRVIHRRIDLRPQARSGSTHRFTTEGWGLVQLYFGAMRTGHGLIPSHTNHNSMARALAWADTRPDLGSPEEWDWHRVARVSRRLVQFIAKHGVAKVGARPVLPAADRAVRAGAILLPCE